MLHFRKARTLAAYTSEVPAGQPLDRRLHVHAQASKSLDRAAA